MRPHPVARKPPLSLMLRACWPSRFLGRLPGTLGAEVIKVEAFDGDDTRRFPHLVHCRVPGFGETGEFGGLPGCHAAQQAMSRLMAVNGNPAYAACWIGLPIVDTCTGMFGCMGILLALPERNRAGKGQMVEVRLHDTAIAMLHPHASNVLNGGNAIRTGNGDPNIAPYDLFPPLASCICPRPQSANTAARFCRALALTRTGRKS